MPGKLSFLITHNLPIYEQLQIEEALLRTSNELYAWINHGSTPAIVVGISGKEDELVDLEKAKVEKLPLIRRFSGGGTVVVDKDTIFFTLIGDKTLIPNLFPDPVLRFTEELLKPVFTPLPFSLQAHDFTLGNHKIGGNAMYLQKERWLIHTSFLWDYNPKRMDSLKHPQKCPKYRLERSHEDFVSKLKNHFKSSKDLIDLIKSAVSQKFSLKKISLDEVKAQLKVPHRKSTHWIKKELH